MSISPITRKSQEFESNRCEKQCDKVSYNEALALIPTIDQKWHEVLKPEISTNEPSDLNTQFSFLEAPAEIKWLILRNLDLPTLVRLSATGKHLYNFVWESIPRLIGCPIRYDAPIYEQVLSFILDLQKKIANIRERSDDIT